MKRLLLLAFLLTYSIIGSAQVSGGSFSAPTCVTGDLSWTNPGTVNTILIFAKAGSAVTTGTPTSNESTYTANPAFGSGTPFQNDAAAFCVYKSTTTGTTASITGLTPGVTYHFLAYNVNAGVYSAAHAFNGATPALTNVTALTPASGDAQVSLTWANPTCFDEIMVVAKPTSTIGGTPTGDGTAYTAVNDFSGAGTPFDGTGKVVYKGTGTTVNITSLTNGNNYFFRAFTRKGTTWSAGAEVSAVPYDDVTSGTFNTNVCVTTGTAAWTNPTTVGTIIVFAKVGSAVNTTPPNANIAMYTADANFSGAGTAYQHDPGAKCVYKGPGTSVNLTGLAAGTTYHFLVFNASGTSYSAPVTFNGSTLSAVPNVTGLTSTAGESQIVLNWANPAACADQILIVAKASSAVTATPTGDGTAYTANAAFGSGTPIVAGEFVVYKGTGTTVTVTGLTNGTTYHFEVFTRNGTTWSSGVTDSEVPSDATPPTVTTRVPADNALNVATNTTLVITFNENIKVSPTAASGNEDDIRIFLDDAPDVLHQSIARGSGSISIVNNVATITITPALTFNEDYYVLIGDKVFSDMSNNNFAGYSATTDWNFHTSDGVTLSTGSASSCVGKFATLSDIVITEDGENDISAGGTIVLNFNGSGYIFEPGQGTATFTAGRNITSASLVADFSSVTITFAISGQNALDQLTISGLRVSTSAGGNPTRNIQQQSGTSTILGISNGTTLGSVSSGTTPAIPGAPVFSSGSGVYCEDDNISATTVSLSGTGIRWYTDATLTTLIPTPGSPVNIAGGANTLGLSSTTPGNFFFYATQTSGCESAARTVPITIHPRPVADAGINQAICPGNSVSIGGTSTGTGGSGTYTYAWTSSPAGFTSSASNPNFAAPGNPGSSPLAITYSVVVTDINTCADTDNMILTVRDTLENIVISQPGSFSFTPTDNPVALVGSVGTSTKPGLFSGVGVVQIDTGYVFDPEIAGLGTWQVTYLTTLTNTCPKSVTEDFVVTNSSEPFEFLENQYCNNETVDVNLELTSAMITQIQNYIANWNSVYVPLYGYAPLKPLRVTLGDGGTGLIIKNEYEYYYGTKSENDLYQDENYVKDGKLLNGYFFNPNAFVTDQYQYPSGQFYNFASLAIYVEFESPAFTYPYNISPGQDYGYAFNTGTSAGFIFAADYVTINHVPNVFFSGLVSEGSQNYPLNVSADNFCNANRVYQLSGNKDGGLFSISPDLNGTYIAGVGTGIQNVGGPGKANFNPDEPFGDAVTSQQDFFVRYSVDPGTTGSTGQGCVGISTQTVYINPLSSLSFHPSTDAMLTPYCYEAPTEIIQTDKTPPFPGITNVAYTGFGISDIGNGTANFQPKAAFDQIVPTPTSQQTVSIFATYTNDRGCRTTISRDYIVFPKPTASYTIPGNQQTFCYNDANITLDGSASPLSSTYTLNFVGVPPADDIYEDDDEFVIDPSVLYDSSVAKGSSPLSDAQVNITYTTTDANNCPATYQKIFTISPALEVSIFGFTDLVYCANEVPKVLTFSPQPTATNGQLRINGLPEPIDPVTKSYVFNKINGTYLVEYFYESGVTGCENFDNKNVRLLASPNAVFGDDVPGVKTLPKCDGVPITYTSLDNTNAVEWQWSLVDTLITDLPAITFTFPKLSENEASTVYPVRLYVKSAPDGATSIVCRDSLTLDQTIGAFPKIDFTYSDVCSGEYTKFNSFSTNVAIAEARWYFEPGVSLPMKPVTAPIAPGDSHSGNTTGNYGDPEHKFSSASRFQVSLVARTGSQFGSCADSVSRQVGILQVRTHAPDNPYMMADLNGGDGFWIEEDRADSTTWEFSIPAGKNKIDNTQGAAWITNATGDYNATDNSYVNSPCFDLSAFDKPVISLQYWNNTDNGNDGAVLQYSLDGGLIWHEVGTTTSGINWYDNSTISAEPGGFNQYGWTGLTQSRWLIGKNSLDDLGDLSSVRFRIAFASDERQQYDGFAFNDVIIEERNRIMLVEHFTNNNDSETITNSNENFNEATALTDNEMVRIQYHTSTPDPDPINQRNPEDHNSRAAYYGLTSQTVPLGFIDGDRDEDAVFGFPTMPATEGWWNDFKQKRSLNASPYSLTVTTQPTDPTKIKIHVTGSKDGVLFGDKPTLYIAVVEKEVDVDGQLYENVLRKFLPNAAGIALDPASLTVDRTEEWTVQGIEDLNDIAIIAFIQDEITKEIHQADMDLNPANLPTALVTATEDPEYARHINLHPNPANNEVNIELPAAVSKPTPVALFDAFGRNVYQATFKAGQQTMKVPTSTFADGIYMMQIITPQGSKTVRKMMVKH